MLSVAESPPVASRIYSSSISLLAAGALVGGVQHTGLTSEAWAQDEDDPDAGQICTDQPKAASIRAVADLFNREPNRAAVHARLEQQSLVAWRVAHLRTLPTDTLETQDRYLATAEGILGPYGINISTEQQLSDEAIAANPGTLQPAQTQLMTPTGRRAVENFVTGYASLPLRYTQMTGLNEFRLRSVPGSNTTAFVRAPRDGSVPRTVFFNIANPGRKLTVAHEGGHGFDNNTCGVRAKYNDPGFEALNPPSMKYGSRNFSTLNYKYSERVSDKIADINGDMNEALDNKNKIRYCQLQALGKAVLKNVAVVSLRSRLSVAEEKAEWYSLLAEPKLLQAALDPHFPTTRRKILYQLAHVYERNAPVVRRVAGYASRPLAVYTSPLDDTYNCASKRPALSGATG